MSTATASTLRIRIPTFEEVEDYEFYIPDWPVYPEHMLHMDDMDYIDADYVTQLIHLSEACRTLKRRGLVAACIFRYLYYHPNLLKSRMCHAVRVKVEEYRGLIAQGHFPRAAAERLAYECDRVSLAISWTGQ
jgi:hypothetical protein